jgi:hypothetical protein
MDRKGTFITEEKRKGAICMSKKRTARKPNPPKWRLPMEVVDLLKHKGGAHTTKSGKRGYDRKRSKAELRGRFAES